MFQAALNMVTQNHQKAVKDSLGVRKVASVIVEKG
jgi:hypothetical protein